MKFYTAEVGKTGSGKVEYGEAYHAVLARYLERGFFPTFKSFPEGEEFNELFHRGDNLPPWRATRIHPAETANWIFERFHGGVQIDLWAIIQKRAEAGKWGEELPDSLRRHVTETPKVLIWTRSEKYMDHRNFTKEGAEQLKSLCEEKEAIPILVGNKSFEVDGLNDGLWNFHKDPWFKTDNIAKQLWFLNLLCEEGNVLASVGMMSGALDGIAMFCGKKVVFFARKEDACPRMAKVVTAVPSLHWVELFYSGNFQRFSDHELAEIERRIWG